MKKEMLKAAYDAATAATRELERCRAIIADIHHRVEELENARFLLDNVGRWADPSDEAHEILFERVNQAEKNLENALASNFIDGAKASVQRAEVEIVKVCADIEAAS